MSNLHKSSCFSHFSSASSPPSSTASTAAVPGPPVAAVPRPAVPTGSPTALKAMSGTLGTTATTPDLRQALPGAVGPTLSYALPCNLLAEQTLWCKIFLIQGHSKAGPNEKPGSYQYPHCYKLLNAHENLYYAARWRCLNTYNLSIKYTSSF